MPELLQHASLKMYQNILAEQKQLAALGDQNNC
jgi:hypothetical protein